MNVTAIDITASPSFFVGLTMFNASTIISMFADRTGTFSSSTPFTWASGDRLGIYGFYRAS
jgi:hypothetical protein